MSTEEWFKNEILYKRYMYIVMWNFFMQSLLIWTVKILDLLISPSFAVVTVSLSTVIYCQISLAVLLTCLCFLLCKNVKVYPELPGTPLSILCCLLRPYSWFQATFLATLGALWSQCLMATLANSAYQHFWQQTPNSSNSCVSEYHFFIVLHGAFLGITFHFAYQLQHLYCLKFESVKQLKLPTAKASIKEQVKQSCFVVLKKVRYFYVIYYLFGFIPKYIVSQTFGQTFCDNVSLTTLSGLFDLELLWCVSVIGVAIYASWAIALSFVQIFLTEPNSFTIETSIEKDKVKVLAKALSVKNCDLLQHLAFQNLSTVAQYSSKGRQKIFAISVPGGHPYVWNEILDCCLQVIDQFQSSLCQAISTGSINSKPTPTSQLNTSAYLGSAQQANGISNFPLTSTPLSPSTKLPQTPSSPVSRLTLKGRNMVDTDIASKTYYSLEPKVPIVKIEKVYVFKGFIVDSFQKILESLMNKPVIKFLTVEPSERKLEKLMCSCQPVIWSVQALSMLVRKSYAEDHNGVVQWDLSKILSRLLELQMTVERCPKGMLRNNHSKESFFVPPKRFSMKLSLDAAINSGLYYITCTFKNNLKYIELSDEHRKRIDRYLQMKE